MPSRETVWFVPLLVISLLVAIGYLVAKLMFWDELQLGLAPLLIGIYFFGAVQLFFIGVLGEYIGAIHTQVHKRPLVVEKERINFQEKEPDVSRGADERRLQPSASDAGDRPIVRAIEAPAGPDGETDARVEVESVHKAS